MTLSVTLTARPLRFSDTGEPEGGGGETPSNESVKGLGITVQGIPPMLRQRLGMDPDAAGVMILSVDPESDAADEGLQPQMVIVSINDKPVKSVADWNSIVRSLKAGSTAKIEYRLGKDRTDSVFVTVPKPK
jgi:serine protease Do